MATSAPAAPIAIPTSDATMAGASFTPSPTAHNPVLIMGGLIGAELLVKADVDTKGMVDFFDRLAMEKNQVIIEYLSTHPAPSERSDGIRNFFNSSAEKTRPLLPGIDWKTTKKSCS